jgi:hypothetical protein
VTAVDYMSDEHQVFNTFLAACTAQDTEPVE